jgi:hypothetical protein
MKAKQADPLQERRNEIARILRQDKEFNPQLTQDVRGMLIREKKHYEKGGNLASWAIELQKHGALLADMAADADAKAKADAAAKAAGEARAKEIDDALRERIAPVDPLTAYKRSVATRTF